MNSEFPTHQEGRTQRFDAQKASLEEWKSFLLNPLTLERNYTKEPPPTSPLQDIIEQITHSDAPADEHKAIVERAVQATLNSWQEIEALELNPLGTTHPFTYIPRLAYKNDEPSEELMHIAQRLWSEAPNLDAKDDSSLVRVARGLGKYIPVDQTSLEQLYSEYFDKYSFLALEIMLERGEVARASELFKLNATRYGDFDPGVFDRLITKGLPPEDAKAWLDQSVNASEGYEGFYNDALRRWGLSSDN